MKSNMNKEEIMEEIATKRSITIPEVQETYQLSYPKAKEIIDELVKKGDFVYQDGITYLSKVAIMQQEIIKDESNKEQLMGYFQERISPIYEELSSLDKQYCKFDDEAYDDIRENVSKSIDLLGKLVDTETFEKLIKIELKKTLFIKQLHFIETFLRIYYANRAIIKLNDTYHHLVNNYRYLKDHTIYLFDEEIITKIKKQAFHQIEIIFNRITILMQADIGIALETALNHVYLDDALEIDEKEETNDVDIDEILNHKDDYDHSYLKQHEELRELTSFMEGDIFYGASNRRCSRYYRRKEKLAYERKKAYMQAMQDDKNSKQSIEEARRAYLEARRQEILAKLEEENYFKDDKKDDKDSDIEDDNPEEIELKDYIEQRRKEMDEELKAKNLLEEYDEDEDEEDLDLDDEYEYEDEDLDLDTTDETSDENKSDDDLIPLNHNIITKPKGFTKEKKAEASEKMINNIKKKLSKEALDEKAMSIVRENFNHNKIKYMIKGSTKIADKIVELLNDENGAKLKSLESYYKLLNIRLEIIYYTFCYLVTEKDNFEKIDKKFHIDSQKIYQDIQMLISPFTSLALTTIENYPDLDNCKKTLEFLEKLNLVE